MSILVLNAGSSTLKFALFDAGARDELAGGSADWRCDGSPAVLSRPAPGAAPLDRTDVMDYAGAVGWILESIPDDTIRVVGHRVVHGGTEFRQSMVIDEQIQRSLEQASRLAPLHNPPALETIAAARSALPDVPHVAVFDTAYFADLPPPAFLYPVPYEWYEQYGIRRFGFHGISHAYCAGRAAEMLGRAEDASLRLVIGHLGSGCSATAVRGDHAVATTMGFTPLEGLMMGARSGSIDPGILLYLLREQGFEADRLEESLNRRSGLLGVSGISSDFRDVERAATEGNERARLAIDMFAGRVRSAIGSLAVSLGGVDALVFTAGIGEHSATLRSQVCAGLECLDLHLDVDRNERCSADCDVATPQSAGRILVIHTREEQRIAQDARRVAQER
jgi:acetate kinase